MSNRLLLACALVLALAGCSGAAREPARPPLTERQRDSVLARSPLPGASVVGRAMSAGDAEAARAAALGAAVDSLPR